MSGGIFGNVFGGLTVGIEKGLNYDFQFIGSFVWCVKTNNTEALSELLPIAEQNIMEGRGAAADAVTVLPSLVGALVAGSDPFAGSRHAFQAWQAKYGVH
jgi:hypothetical protein